MRTRTLLLVLAAVFVCSTFSICKKPPPATPGAPIGPDSTWTGVSTPFKVVTTAKGNIRYVMDWIDKIDTTDVSYASKETATVAHKWDSAATYSIKVQAILDAEPAKASDWSPTKDVRVIPNSAPTVDDVAAPPVAVKNIEAFFTIKASDADGDSMRINVDWGDNKDTTTSYFANPCSVEVSHVFTTLDTFEVSITAEDWKGAETDPPHLETIPVGKAGGVMWYWWNDDENREPLTTSPVIAFDGDEDCVYSGCEEEYSTFRAIKVANGRSAGSTSPKYSEWVFTGHPAFCSQTGHIIVGSDEGELYAMDVELHKDWQWPDRSPEESLTGLEWGAPAISGNKIYIGHADDSLFLFEDNTTQPYRVATYPVNASIVDAPIIDAQGNVIFCNDSGYLIKIDGAFNPPLWRSHLLANGEIHGPILGSDGTIYCASDSSRIYSINPTTGNPNWTITTDGDAFRLALGQSALFVGTAFGKAYSINPATGGFNWQIQLTPGDGISTTPVVTDSGIVYFQDESDVLYCVEQATGTVIWSCDCKRYLPRTGSSPRPRKMQLTDYYPSPTITATGNVIVIGTDATYCVAGYPEATLDVAAPWPKWQKNLYNTGK